MTSQTCNALVLQFCPNGQLFDLVVKESRLPPTVACNYLIQLLSALECLHSHGLFHRDVKPQNILLDSDLNLKLADFGLSSTKNRKKGPIFKTLVGTQGYMPPEVTGLTPYDPVKVDLFGVGVVLFIMITGRPPFEAARKDDAYYKLIWNKRWDIFWKAH